METKLIEIIKIGATLIGGGAAGSIITAIINKRRLKIQSIKKTVEITKIFTPDLVLDNFVSRITLSGSTAVYHFDTLYIAKIEIVNSGNLDFAEFTFGITLPESVFAVNVQTNTQDRHHTVNIDPAINFNTPSPQVDFKLIPFNRKNSYKIDIYLTSYSLSEDIDLKFSSIEPVRFVETGVISITTSELLRALLTSLIKGSMEIKIR